MNDDLIQAVYSPSKGRSGAREVECPKCHAPPRTACMGRRGPRVAYHRERHGSCWNGFKTPSRGVREARCNEPGWVYLIAAKGTKTAKIGFSRKYPSARRRTLQTANPHELQLLMMVRGTRRDEQAYHERFAHIHVRGEWFQDTSELRDFFAGML